MGNHANLEVAQSSTDFGAAFEAGAATKIVTKTFEGIQHAMIPAGSDLISMEELMDAPKRIKASPEFYDVGGFIDYTEEFAEAGTRIFVNQGDWRFFTIFDAPAKGQPAWGDHCASLQLKKSPEWKRFVGMDSVKLSPMELAEFIEENIEYFKGPLVGAELLTMAQNLKVDLKGDLQIDHTTQAGLKHLVIKDDSVLSGRSGDKDLAFPEKVDLSLRVFDQHTAYSVSVFLRYRASKEGVKFWFKVPDVPGIEEAAFEKVIEEIREKSGLKTLKGRYQGPSHK